MSEEREGEQAGAPVDQEEVTETQVLAAVERAAEVGGSDAVGESAADSPIVDASHGAGDLSNAERPVIAEVTEPSSAGASESAGDIFASHPPRTVASTDAVSAQGQGYSAVGATAAAPAPAGGVTPAPAPLPGQLPPARDGEIRISADHPMAALYMQTPMPPNIRGNRGAGVLISLLATLAFAAVLAGALALWVAPSYPPSTFLTEGLLPWVVNWGFAAAAVGFFVSLSLLVLVVGRAGWWAYVIGGFFVAAITWIFALVGFALHAHLAGEQVSFAPMSLLVDFGLFFPVIAAGIVARESSVWFGAWIGARGRKMKRLNAEALAEYEQAMTEVQAKQQ